MHKVYEIRRFPNLVSSRSQKTVSRSTFSRPTVRLESVRCRSLAIAMLPPYAASAAAGARWAPMLSPTRAAAARSAPRIRRRYRAVV